MPHKIPNSGRRNLLGFLSVSLAAIFFGCQPAFVKQTYQCGLNAVTVTFFQCVIAGVLLFPVLRLRHIPLRTDKKERNALLLLGSIECITCTLYNAAANYISSGSTTALHYFFPTVVMVFECVCFRRRLTWKKGLTAAAILLGVMLFMELRGSSAVLGSSLALASAFSYAVYILSVERFAKNIDASKIAFYIAWVTAAELFLFGTATGQLQFRFPASALTGILLTALFCQLGGKLLFAAGIKRIGSTAAAFASALEPLTSIVMGVIFYQDSLTFKLAAAAILITGGLILNAQSEPAART